MTAVAKKQQANVSPLEVEISRWLRNTAGEVVETRIMALDYVLDGGLRTGRIVEIYGPEQSGKTTLMLHIVRAFLEQKKGTVIYIDTEHALDERWAKLNGVDFEDRRFKLIQPDSTNEALQVVEKLAKYPEVSLIVLDSLPALALEEELEAEDFQATQPGLLARAFNRTLRILTSLLPRNGSCFVFSNQLRSSMTPYGSPETTPGGRMKNYAASYRLEVRRKDWIGTKKEPTGIVSTVRAVKNKCGQPYRTADIYITTNGLDVATTDAEFLLMLGLVTRNGSHYTLNSNTLLGKSALVNYLQQNRDQVYTLFKQKLEELRNQYDEPWEVQETDEEH